jgi:4-alpha-glucanotransferase
MRFPRSSGILLHPTSLPGPFGIGDLGGETIRFIDFLVEAGQTVWQVLPLGPTGYGDSPYQCFSALAGNPLLISLERLADEGLLKAAELHSPSFPLDSVDFARVIPWKGALLETAARRFLDSAAGESRASFDAFCSAKAHWLEDFARFMALKQRHHGAVWTRWETDADGNLDAPIAIQKFLQFAFFSQWNEVRRYCHERGIRIMGDLPIYVAHDSVDVWADPGYFQLDAGGNPAVVAGVPPDYFSATGQRWGNPIYRWDALAADEYRWWIVRFREALELVDLIRLDHFRGFQAYWEVPASEPTAVNGRWVDGPGAALFQAAQKALGELPLIAENLGVITPPVEEIRCQFGFPGMAILQFAFGKDPQAPTFRPHNYTHELVAYSGTHDNDTTLGWWTSDGRNDSTRTADDIRREREFTRAYLNTNGREIHWDFIRALEASVADTVLIPLQDVLGLGSEARMNQPATLGGNWRWRFRREALTKDLAGRLQELTNLYERTR